MQEEVGIEDIIIATDDLHFHNLRLSAKHDPQKQALIRMIDHDPWQGSVVRVKSGEPWFKRSNAVVYAGLFDGPFRFTDGEAVDHRSVLRHELLADIQENPCLYADGARIFMQRYYHILL